MSKLAKAKSDGHSNKDRIVRNIDKVKGLQGTKSTGKTFYKPTTQEEFEQLADELLKWSQLNGATNINDFPLSKDISPYRFKRYENEYFQHALETAKYRIASRNRDLVNTKLCEKEIYFKELYLLDQDYKEAEDDKIAKRVKGIKQAMGNVQLIDHMMDE